MLQKSTMSQKSESSFYISPTSDPPKRVYSNIQKSIQSFEDPASWKQLSTVKEKRHLSLTLYKTELWRGDSWRNMVRSIGRFWYLIYLGLKGMCIMCSDDINVLKGASRYNGYVLKIIYLLCRCIHQIFSHAQSSGSFIRIRHEMECKLLHQNDRPSICLLPVISIWETR